MMKRMHCLCLRRSWPARGYSVISADNGEDAINSADKIKLLLGYATYPDDAITNDELIEKAKELQGKASVALF